MKTQNDLSVFYIKSPAWYIWGTLVCVRNHLSSFRL